MSLVDLQRIYLLKALGLPTNSTLSISDLQSLYSQASPPTSNKAALLPAGVIAETFPRRDAISNAATTNSQLRSSIIYLEQGQVITSVSYLISVTASAGATHAYHALLDKNGTVLATSADDTSAILTVNTKKTYPLITPYTVPASDFYYVARSYTATTMPTVAAHTNQLSVSSAEIPLLSFTVPSLPTPPTVGTLLTPVSTSQIQDYAQVS